MVNKNGFKSPNRELEVKGRGGGEEEEEKQAEYKFRRERIIDNSMCIFILESILLSTFLPS